MSTAGRQAGDNDSVGVGILGTGNIFQRYVKGIAKFRGLTVVGCASDQPDQAATAAEEAGVGYFPSVAEMLASADVDVVVNITPPLRHASTTQAVLEAGKHVYVEKPITSSLSTAQELLATAGAKKLLVGAAPDTFLGSAGQTARRALDAGLIGEPIGVAGFLTSVRVETWHPNPSFLFQPGGGPVYDMGPYYLTAMVNLLGPILSVAASARVGVPKIALTAPDRLVESVDVNVPTHASVVLEFSSAVVGTLLASFDVWDHHLPRLEVYGSEGTLSLPDPNTFDGDVLVKRRSDDEWHVLAPTTRAFADPGSVDQYMRGPGVADLAGALRGEPHRANGALAVHVLEAIEGIERSYEEAAFVRLSSTVERPAPVPETDAIPPG